MLCLYRSITPTILLFIREAIDCHALIFYEYPPQLGLERNFTDMFSWPQTTKIELLHG